MIFDPAQLADLHAAEKAAKEAFAEVSLQINELNATDEWTQEKRENHMHLQLVHGQRERELKVARDQRVSYEGTAPLAEETPRDNALKRFLRSGPEGLDKDEREYWLGEAETESHGFGGPTFKLRAEDPTMATRSDTASGQEAVEETVYPGLVNRLSHYGGVQEAAKTFLTSSGNDFRYPQLDSTTQKGTLRVQDSEASTVDINNIGVVSFGAYTFSSEKIGITREMIQDAIFDVEREIEMRAANRLGRIESEVFTTRTGAGGPLGVVGLASTGITTSTQTGVSWEELVDLQYAVNRAYRVGSEMGPGGLSNPMMGNGMKGYLISDSLEQVIRKLEDDDGRPLWLPSVREGMPNMIHGKPYRVSGDMADVAAGATTALFGDFSYFCIRRVNNVEVFRFWDSATATNNRIEIIAFSRCDSRAAGALVGGKCEAFVKLDHAS